MVLKQMQNFVVDSLDKQENLLISIVWIGHILDPRSGTESKIIEEIGQQIEQTGEDGSEYYPRLELNHLGESICLNEYATMIAEVEHTHVLHIDVVH